MEKVTMDRIDLYEASIEKIIVNKPNNIAKSYRVFGLFVNKQDAIDAVKLYEVVHRALGENLSHNIGVGKKSFPKNLRHRYYKRYYENLDEFIKDDTNIVRYLQVNNLTVDELLAEINNRDAKAKKDISIIERMIRQYKYRLKIDRATGTAQEVIDEYEENIKYLESLRDEKTGFTK